ncbi:taste receptor type 2 member 1 [Choloepus didactylus]|uniref:taste receptor type 2 member 1 n=1 Tax=Choloepus didactylus TaxID=27675 RepID=UPI00189FFC10|nr:taste receptor type 2 member 1 [Choloepus didactylus]
MHSFHLIHLLSAVIQFLIGIFANGVILIVNGAELIKNRRMSSLELLLSCLAISRIGIQWSILYVNLYFLSLIELVTFTENFLVFLFMNELALWLATWLGVFYCIKITNIAHPFFWLKRRISKLVPWLILGSLLYSLIAAFLHNENMWSYFKDTWLNKFSENATTQTKELAPLQFGFLVFELSSSLFIFLAAVLPLMFSLGRHARQMRNTAVGARNWRVRAHVSALLSILSFLILYVSFYTTTALFSFGIFNSNSLNFLFHVFVLGTYPSGHSVILILGNPKLKENAKRFLLHSKCCQ